VWRWGELEKERGFILRLPSIPGDCLQLKLGPDLGARSAIVSGTGRWLPLPAHKQTYTYSQIWVTSMVILGKIMSIESTVTLTNSPLPFPWARLSNS